MKRFIIPVLSLSILLLSACAATEYVATVGDINISEAEFRGYLYSIKSQMSDTELRTDEDWEINEIEGEKAIDVARRRALDNATMNALYIEAAKMAGISLDTEELTELENTKNQIVLSYGGEKAYKKFLKENNISDDFFERICMADSYRMKIAEKIVAENPDGTEPKEYYDQNTEAFQNAYKKAKHILILTKNMETGEPKSEEEIAKAKTLSDDILKRAKAGEDFDKLMHEYSEDTGLDTNPDGYVFTTGEMVQPFEQAVFAANVNEITFCESDFGYHIIKRLPLSYDDVADKVMNVMLTEMVDEQVLAWQAEFGLLIQKNEEILSEIK